MRAKEGPSIWEVELEPQVPSLYLQPCRGRDEHTRVQAQRCLGQSWPAVTWIVVTVPSWPPQVLAAPGQRRAGPVVAVAPWAGRAVLPEGVLRARGLLAVTVLAKVTLVLHGAAQLSGRLHLVPGDQDQHGNGRPPARTPALSPGPRLTLHSWQQVPWAHSAPSASRQVLALQQRF